MFTNGNVSSMVRMSDGTLVAAVRLGWGCAGVADTSWGIYRSANKGLSWTKLGVVRAETWSLTLHPGGALFAATDTGVYRSSDGGAAWKRIGLEQGWVNALAVTGDGWLFAATEKGLFRSSNEGATWAPLSTMYLGQANSVIAGKNGEIVVLGTEQGAVIRSTDRGGTWFDMNKGVVYEYVGYISAGEPEGYLCIAGGKGYVWNAAAAEWAPSPTEGLGQAYMVGMVQAPSGFIYAWTSEGVFRSNLPLTGIAPVFGGVGGEFRLEQNYPNPFNSNSDIRYQISEFRMVKIAVYDLLGREVAVLVNEKKAAGTYRVQFDAGGLASGVYICRLTAGTFQQTRRMILVR